jgi:hypothetical protein
MQVAQDAFAITVICDYRHGRRLLGRFLHLHRSPMMVKMIEDFIETTISSSGTAGIGQNRVQQIIWDGRYFQSKMLFKRQQTTHGTGCNEQQNIEKGCFCPDENPVSGQDVLIG